MREKISYNGKLSLCLSGIGAILILIATIFVSHHIFSGILLMLSILLLGVNFYILTRKG